MKQYKKLIIKIFKLFAFGIMIWLFIYLGTRDYEADIPDNIRFANEYIDISKNNVFDYTKNEEIIQLLNNGSGIIFMGFSSNIWSHYYADYLNKAALDNDIDKIYYYDFNRDRSINNATYENIVKRLKPHIILTDTNRADLSAPTVVIVKNGSVIYYNDEVNTIRGEVQPEEYFTDYKKNYVYNEFVNAIKLYKGELE